MKYLLVRWTHTASESESKPVVLLSELDDERFEVRKVYEFADGRLEFVDGTRTATNVFLGEVAVPEIAEINSDSAFQAQEITQQQFESYWERALAISGAV